MKTEPGVIPLTMSTDVIPLIGSNIIPLVPSPLHVVTLHGYGASAVVGDSRMPTTFSSVEAASAFLERETPSALWRNAFLSGQLLPWNDGDKVVFTQVEGKVRTRKGELSYEIRQLERAAPEFEAYVQKDGKSYQLCWVTREGELVAYFGSGHTADLLIKAQAGLILGAISQGLFEQPVGNSIRFGLKP
jgi:hypothetical protein